MDENNKLKLNEDKTEFLVISSRSNSVKISVDCLELSEDIVHASPSARNLGVIMDAHLSLENHVNQIRKTCFYFLNWIRKVRTVFDPRSR